MTFVLEMSLSIKVFSVGSYREYNTNMLHQTYLSQALNVLGFVFFSPTSAFFIPSASLCVSHQRNSQAASYLGWAGYLGH